jgi:hypothetical protein
MLQKLHSNSGRLVYINHFLFFVYVWSDSHLAITGVAFAINKSNVHGYIPILLYVIPTVINNKEISPHDTITENEITTTTTVIYNQIMGTITTLLVLYILITLIVVVNIINVSKGPLRHIN